MHKYCLVFQGEVGKTYLYTDKENVNELAKYVNSHIAEGLGICSKVEGVYLVDSWDSPLKVKVFLPTEYKEQYFLETYEDRLREGYRIQRLAF